MGTGTKVLLGVVGFCVLALGGCVALIAVAGNSISDSIEEAQDERAADEALIEDNTVITKCEIGEFRTATARVEFTNPLQEEKGFISIEVNFLDGNTVVGSARAVFENLSPGQNAVGEATAFNLPDEVTALSCEVVDGTIL